MSKRTSDLVGRLRELPRDTHKATLEIYDLCVEASYKIEELTDRCARYAEEIAVLRERVEAGKDERVVVLPVKPVLAPVISSMLYIIEDGDIYEDALYEAVVGMSASGETNVVYTTLSDQIIFEQDDIGKTVFLTRKEAEKALEAMKEDETKHA